MMDKDKVLPLVHFSRCIDTVHRLRCHEEQQDADWERVKALMESLKGMLRWFGGYPEFTPAPGHPDYDGPTGPVGAIKATRAALAQLEEKP